MADPVMTWKNYDDGAAELPPLIDRCGYLARRIPDHPLANTQGHVLEHRRVAWHHAGPFPRDRHVHHRNGDKHDNRWENLEVLTPEAHGREHHQIDRAEVARLYVAGLTQVEVAETVGTFGGNVSRILRDQGVTIRPAHLGRPDLDRDEIGRRLQAGEPVGRIARDLGCSHPTIDRERRRLGLPPRKAGRPPVAPTR